jgi:hemoglobin
VHRITGNDPAMVKRTHPQPFAALSALVAIVVLSPVATAETASLYARLGGQQVVQAIADDVIDDAASDPKLKRCFAKVNVVRVKSLLAEQICEVTGGGCKYTGDSMHDVHAGLGITEAEFYGLVEVLRTSMRRHGVGLRERNELLQILAPMKRDVVER